MRVQLYLFIVLGLGAGLLFVIQFHLRRLLQIVFPRKVSYLNDPAPLSVIYQNRKGLSWDEKQRDDHRTLWNKTSTQVGLYNVSIWVFQLVFIWFPLSLVLVLMAVVGMVLLMTVILG